LQAVVRRPYPLWWREKLRCYEHSGLIRVNRRPITWAKAPAILKLDWYQRALWSFGDVWTFTLRLRHDIEAEAKGRPDPANWLGRRIAYHLERALGRQIQFVAVLEEDVRYGLHIHGVLCITHNDRQIARKALRLAGGEWEKVRQHQAHIHPYAPDEGWASYCGKSLHMVSPSVREMLARHGSPKLLVSYSGNPLFVSRELGQRARELFDATRLRLLKAAS
jgi:hypothetical protein